ncbi:MAG: hypothetical protein ACLRWP_13005 [Bilophila wadsworthia]
MSCERTTARRRGQPRTSELAGRMDEVFANTPGVETWVTISGFP